MAKLVASLNVSWGGHCGHEAGLHDADSHALMIEAVRGAGALLLGRNTFEMFENFWPRAAHDPKASPHLRAMGQALGAATKIVVSSDRIRSDWSHCSFIRGDLTAEITKVKAETPKNLLMLGSVSLHRELRSLKLIDEYEFLLQPMAIADEPRLFADLESRLDFALVSMRSLPSGVVVLRYRPVPGRSPS